MMTSSRGARAAALAVSALAAGGVAVADVGFGPPVRFSTGSDVALSPTLRLVVQKDPPATGPDYDYVSKGFFKVHATTVARLPSFAGRADGTKRTEKFALSRTTRHRIRAAAKSTGSHRVTLTITTVATTVDDAHVSTALRQDLFLRIPRR
jgi:hypothetical protein